MLKGHYHLMWDTQMGEETFADAKVMTDDQLADKLRVLRGEVARLEEEEGTRRPGKAAADSVGSLRAKLAEAETKIEGLSGDS